VFLFPSPGRPQSGSDRHSKLQLLNSSTIATALVQSKSDCCNSLYVNITNETSQHATSRSRNTVPVAICAKSKINHILHMFQSFHRHKMKQRINYTQLVQPTLVYGAFNNFLARGFRSLLLNCKNPAIWNSPSCHLHKPVAPLLSPLDTNLTA